MVNQRISVLSFANQNSFDSEGHSSSVVSKKEKITVSQALMKKFEQFKRFVVNNTQLEVESELKFLHGNKAVNIPRAPGTAANCNRSTVSFNTKVRMNTPAVSRAPFTPILPSQIRSKTKQDHKNDLYRVLSVTNTKTKVPEHTISASKPLKHKKNKVPVQKKPVMNPTDFSKIDEYKEEEKQKQHFIEKLKKSKKQYTFKYKKLHYNSLKYKVEDVFRPQNSIDNIQGTVIC